MLWQLGALAIIVVVSMALSVVVADLAGQWWLAVVRVVGVPVMGGGQGGDYDSGGGSGSNG